MPIGSNWVIVCYLPTCYHKPERFIDYQVGGKNGLVYHHLGVFNLVVIWGTTILDNHPGTWRIIPFSKWLVTPIYKPFRPFGRGITPFRGLTITMVINHLLNGMILQVAEGRGPGKHQLPLKKKALKRQTLGRGVSV